MVRFEKDQNVPNSTLTYESLSKVTENSHLRKNDPSPRSSFGDSSQSALLPWLWFRCITHLLLLKLLLNLHSLPKPWPEKILTVIGSQEAGRGVSLDLAWASLTGNDLQMLIQTHGNLQRK